MKNSTTSKQQHLLIVAKSTLVSFLVICTGLNIQIAKGQSYSTNGGNVTWTLSGTSSITEGTLYISGTGQTHGDAFDGAVSATVSGSNISYSTSYHLSQTYSVAIQQVIVTNGSGSSSTYNLSCTGNLGSDGSTYWHYVNYPSYNYTISSDNSSASTNGSDPVVSLIYGWNNGYGSSSISYTNNSDAQSYSILNVPIAAYTTHRYLFLVGLGSIDDQSNNRADNAYQAVVNVLQYPSYWPADFTSYLTGAQMAEVKNWTLTVPNVVAGTPTSLSNSASGTTTANLSWAAGSPSGTPAPTYYWTLKNQSGNTVTSGSTSSTSASVSGLSANTSYYFTVYANNSSGNSGTATSSSFTTYPDNPTSISGTTSICNGSSTTLTANGAQGSVYWYTGGCGSTYVNTGNTLTVSPSSSTTYYARNNNGNWSSGCASTTVTVNSLPTVAAISGSSSVCISNTTTLSNSTAGGTWSSSNTGIATVNTSGVVSGVAAGSATITYTVTNANNCSQSVTKSITVVAAATAPSSVTATPSTIQNGQSSNLNATSAGNMIRWYTASTGGTAIGTSASGANYSVSPSNTTTYYAESYSPGAFYISSMLSTGSAIAEHDSYTGDDRGGIAISSSYVYYTGDSYTVRYDMSGLTNPTRLTRRDGLFSDLSDGTLYTLWNGSSDPTYSTNTGTYTVTHLRALNTDMSLGNTYIALSSSVTLNGSSAAIYAGSGFVILQNNLNFYRIDLASGSVTSTTVTTSISRQASESWATWGVAEKMESGYCVLYRESGTQNIRRFNLSTQTISTLATFTNLGDMASFTFSKWNNRWYYHYEGGAQFGGSSETLGYATGAYAQGEESCPSATRTAVTVTISNPPTVTTGSSVSTVSNTGATIVSNVTAQGGSSVTSRGVCYSTSQSPSISGTKTTNGTGTGEFTSTISGLTAGTLYYARAYATNAQGTSYGSEISFTTYSPGVIGGAQSVCVGSTPALLTSTSAAVAMPSVSYQWQSSTNNVDFSNISGATSATYQPGIIESTTYYRRNAISGGTTLSSNTVTVSINQGAALASAISASPATILSGQSSNLSATVASGNEVKWYTSSTGGSPIGTSASGANYAVSPTVTTTYYAQTSPVQTSNRTLSGILSNLNSNYANIAAQIPSKYTISNDASNYINDGGGDMYDGGNYLSTNNTSNFSYSDNSITTNSTFGTNSGYFTRFINGMFFLAADMNNVSNFKVYGNYGSDGGGSRDSYTFNISVNGMSFNCFVSRIYNAGDPSINEMIIIPANPSATYRAIANTSIDYSQLSDLNSSTRLYYFLYASSSGGYVNNSQTYNIASSFLSQIGAVITGSNDCPSASRSAVTVTVSGVPVITTSALSEVSSTTATCGGNITSTGGQSITARGVCWSTSQNPTTANIKTTDGTGSGEFSSSITGLTAGTTYYVRAYATNAMGTGYGEQLTLQPFALGTFSNINKTYGDLAFTLTNPSSLSNGTFSYTSSDTDVATISGNTVTIVGAGTSTITCAQAVSGVYAQATKSATLTVAKKNQTLTLTVPTTAPLNTFVGSSLQLSASSNSGLAVTIRRGGTSTVAGTVSYTSGNYYLSEVGSTGTMVIEATQAGNDNYNEATISRSFDVTKGNQTITFNALSAKTYGNSAFTVSATGGASDNAVTFTSSNTAVATCGGTNGATITIVGAGSTVITANQAGNTNWNAANAVSQTLTVNKATPSVSNFGNITKTYTDAAFELNVSSASTGVVRYSSSNSAVATIVGNTVTITGVGTSTLTATQAADDNYAQATATCTLTVSEATQSISFDALDNITLTDFEANPIEIAPTSTSGLAVQLQVSGAATLSGNTLTTTGATGTVTVTASQAGNDNYSAATNVVRSFTVSKSNQTINFGALSAVLVSAQDFDLSATATSNLAVSFVSSNTAVATVTGKTIHVVGVGSTTITATQSGNDYYYAASSVQQTLTVNKGTQTITFDALEAKVVGDAAFTVSATGGDSGNPVVFTSSNTNVASCIGTNGTTITIIGAGSCTINANQTGNTTYNAASQVSRTLIIAAKSIAVSSATASVAKEVGSIATINVISNTSWTASSNEAWLLVSPASGTGNETLTVTADTPNNTANSRTATVTISSAGATSRTITVTQVGVPASDLHYRTTNQSCWSNEGQWETSTDGVNWTAYPGEPNTTANSLTVCNDVELPTTKEMVVSVINVDPTARLDVKGNINANSKIIINSNETNTGQILNSGTLSNSNATVVLRKTLLKNKLWYFMSFPYNVPLSSIKITSTQATATKGNFITDQTRTANLYIIEYNGLKRDQTGQASASEGQNWEAKTTGSLEAGKGYALLVMTDQTFDFISGTGENNLFDSSTKALSIGVYNSNQNTLHHSWNLVGVPYSAAFNVDNLDQGSFYYIYDASRQSYVVEERSTSYKLNPFGAFFVQATAETINFASAGRTFRAPSAKQTTEYDEIALVLKNNSYSDITKIRLWLNAKDSYEMDKDAVKMLSQNTVVPQLWSKSSVYNLSVNSLPQTIKEVWLNNRIGVAGNYSIEIANPEKLQNLSKLTLIDNIAGTQTDLLSNPKYDFYSATGTSTNRFKIVLQSDITTKTTEISANGIQVNTLKNFVTIRGIVGEALVRIYDAAGKATQNFHKVKDGETITLQPLTGFYFVEIITDTQHHKEKVFIKK